MAGETTGKWISYKAMKKIISCTAVFEFELCGKFVIF
jgi:hypothetical protein